MDFNGLIVLAAVWFLFNLINNVRRKSRGAEQSREPGLRPRPLPSRLDPTQREGSRLELVLRELQRSLEEAAQTGRSTAMQLPTPEVEEPESLEVDPEVRSLEEEVHRESRAQVDRDDEAGDIEARRIQAAAARDVASTKKDHLAFDQRIRQQPADHTATRGYTAQQLRDAVVWREILGPPVSERGER